MAYGGFGFQDTSAGNSRIGNLQTGSPENFGLLQNIEPAPQANLAWPTLGCTRGELGLETPSSMASERCAASFPWNSSKSPLQSSGDGKMEFDLDSIYGSQEYKLGSSPGLGRSWEATSMLSPGGFTALTPAKSIVSDFGSVKSSRGKPLNFDVSSASRGSPFGLGSSSTNDYTSIFSKSSMKFTPTIQGSVDAPVQRNHAPRGLGRLGSQDSAISLSQWSGSSEDTVFHGRASNFHKSEPLDQKMQWGDITGSDQILRDSSRANSVGSYRAIGHTSGEHELNNLISAAAQELSNIQICRASIEKHLGHTSEFYRFVERPHVDVQERLRELLDFSVEQFSELANLAKELRIGENKGVDKMKKAWATLNSGGVGIQPPEGAGRALSHTERKARTLLREMPNRIDICCTISNLIRSGFLRDDDRSGEKLEQGSVNSLLETLTQNFVHIKTLLIVALNEIEPASVAPALVKTKQNNFVEETEERGALRNTRFPPSRKQLIPKSLSASGRKVNSNAKM